MGKQETALTFSLVNMMQLNKYIMCDMIYEGACVFLDELKRKGKKKQSFNWLMSLPDTRLLFGVTLALSYLGRLVVYGIA